MGCTDMGRMSQGHKDVKWEIQTCKYQTPKEEEKITKH